MRVTVAKGMWKVLLTVTGCAAVTMPWRKVYVLEPYLSDAALLAHERVHIEQINREGPVRFSVRYLWYLVTRGYRANPFEIEAYERAPL